MTRTLELTPDFIFKIVVWILQLSKNDNDTRFGSGVGRRRGQRERMEVDYLEGQFPCTRFSSHLGACLRLCVKACERERERA